MSQQNIFIFGTVLLFAAVSLIPAIVASSSSLSDIDTSIIDFENGSICRDIDEKQCPYWAATGECQSNKDFMTQTCKKSCNRCNVIRVNNHKEMNSFIQQKQQEFNILREERRKERESLQVLSSLPSQQPDNVVTTKTTTMTSLTVVDSQKDKEKNAANNAVMLDYNDDADQYKKEKTSSNSNTTTATKSSPIDADNVFTSSSSLLSSSSSSSSLSLSIKTASSSNPSTTTTSATSTSADHSTSQQRKEKSSTSSTIIMDAETGLECIDQDEANCPYWAATGECKKNRTWMYSSCKKSCDRCHVVRVTNQRSMNQFISQKNKEAKQQRQQKKKDQEMIRILQNDEL